jgi:hypothetical protein
VIAALLALLVGAVPVTVLPRPSFPEPAQAPKPGRIHFVVVSDRLRTLTDSLRLTIYGKSFRGLPRQRVANHLEIYGKDGSSGRYVVAPGRYAFDFAKYVWPPRYVREDREFVYEQVVWAREADTGILYVETAHFSYARSSYGLNGYLNAIDLKTRKLLWRSPAQVANAGNFVMLSDVLVSGYGFTDEPDYLYALSRATGRVVARLLLPNAPERIVRRGTTLYVRTYDHDLVVRVAGD